MKISRLIMTLVATLALLGQIPPAHAEEEGACRAEAEKLCPDMKPGDGKFGPCMKEHKDELSQACKDKMRGMMEGRRKANGDEGSHEDKQGDHQ